MSKNKEQIVYEKFLELQQETHLKNQKKIRVGLKVNILLPLVFLAISFISNRSKLVFLVLWIASLFGIAFYLLYVEYMDFKLQEQLKQSLDQWEERLLEKLSKIFSKNRHKKCTKN